MDYKDMSSEQLTELKHQIISACSYWKGSQDGSYEMAMRNRGLHAVNEELARRQKSS
jgi:hypothetical protein